jgi:hypothetical protein
MKFSNNAFLFFLVLAAADNAVTAVKEAKIKLSDHPELRGGSTTPVESLTNADSRMLGVIYPAGLTDVKGTWVGEWTPDAQAGLAVQAGSALTFTAPAATISSGDVCGYAAIAGFKDIYYSLEDGAFFVNGCDPAAASLNGESLDDLLGHELAIQQDTVSLEALVLVSGELGGRTVLPGAYKTDGSITVDAGTVVTLRGNTDSKFLFLSVATIVTGADTIFKLVPEDEQNGPPQAKNILLVSAGATNTGANSVLQGSILSGAAITLNAVSEVSGGVFAKAAISGGARCTLNKAKVLNVRSQLNTLLASSSVPVGGLKQPLPTTDPLTDAFAIQEAFALNAGELGGQTVSPGAYKTDSSLTVASGTVVTL